MKNKLFYIIIGIVVLVGGYFLISSSAEKNGANAQAVSQFAACLKDKGAVFYGAFWCPHCDNQKKMFGAAADELPYVECSTSDSQGQTPACSLKKISAYPTWEFGDGSRLTGELSFEELAQKTSCEAPTQNI